MQNWLLLKLLATVSAVGVLAISLNDAYGEMFGYSESQITVGERQVYCTQDKIEAELVVRDLDGNVITQTAARSEVSMESTLKLDCNTSANPLTMLFEVQDSDGITTYFILQQVPVSSVKQITVGASWISDRPGEYTIRFFHITCLNCPGVVLSVEQYKVTVY